MIRSAPKPYVEADIRIILAYASTEFWHCPEKSGGLSTELKQRIAVTKIAIIGNEAAEPIAQAIGRMGLGEVNDVN